LKYMIVGLGDKALDKLDNFIGIVKMTEQSIERPTEILATLIVAGMRGGKESMVLDELPDNLLRDDE